MNDASDLGERKQAFTLFFLLLCAGFFPVFLIGLSLEKARDPNVALIPISILIVAMILPIFWREGLTWRELGTRLKKRPSWLAVVIALIPFVIYLVASKIQFQAVPVDKFVKPRGSLASLFDMPIALMTLFACLLLSGQQNRVRAALMVGSVLALPKAFVALSWANFDWRMSEKYFPGLVSQMIWSQVGAAVAHACLACFFVVALPRRPWPLLIYLASIIFLPYFCPVPLGAYYVLPSAGLLGVFYLFKKSNLFDQPSPLI